MMRKNEEDSKEEIEENSEKKNEERLGKTSEHR